MEGKDIGLILALAGKGGGGGGSHGIFVGSINENSAMPTKRPDGSALQNEDYVRVDSYANVPFSIGSLRFETRSDKAIFYASAWMLEPGVLQDTSETPVKNKDAESVSGEATTQAEANEENVEKFGEIDEKFDDLNEKLEKKFDKADISTEIDALADDEHAPSDKAVKNFVEKEISEQKIFRFCGFFSAESPDFAEAGDLWFGCESLPESFPIECMIFDGEEWTGQPISYSAERFDLWKFGEKKFYFDDGWKELGGGGSVEVDDETIEEKDGKLQVKDGGISLEKMANQSPMNKDKILAVDEDGNIDLSLAEWKENTENKVSEIKDEEKTDETKFPNNKAVVDYVEKEISQKASFFNFKGYFSVDEPLDGRDGNLWSMEVNMPTEFPLQHVRYFEKGKWQDEEIEYTPIAGDLWFNRYDGHSYYYAGDKWNLIDGNVEPDMKTIDINAQGELQIVAALQEKIDGALQTKQGVENKGKVPTVNDEGDLELQDLPKGEGAKLYKIIGSHVFDGDERVTFDEVLQNCKTATFDFEEQKAVFRYFGMVEYAGVEYIRLTADVYRENEIFTRYFCDIGKSDDGFTNIVDFGLFGNVEKDTEIQVVSGCRDAETGTLFDVMTSNGIAKVLKKANGESDIPTTGNNVIKAVKDCSIAVFNFDYTIKVDCKDDGTSVEVPEVEDVSTFNKIKDALNDGKIVIIKATSSQSPTTGNHTYTVYAKNSEDFYIITESGYLVRYWYYNVTREIMVFVHTLPRSLTPKYEFFEYTDVFTDGDIALVSKIATTNHILVVEDGCRAYFNLYIDASQSQSGTGWKKVFLFKPEWKYKPLCLPAGVSKQVRYRVQGSMYINGEYANMAFSVRFFNDTTGFGVETYITNGMKSQTGGINCCWGMIPLIKR